MDVIAVTPIMKLASKKKNIKFLFNQIWMNFFYFLNCGGRESLANQKNQLIDWT